MTTLVSRARSRRDLRRHYGADYRIVRAESGDQALDALSEIKLRGDVVALLLADYRMPQMNGIAFLEQAMDLYPTARRVLLTAYADTNAAIDAINVVDLDHYLLKPWDPPEEKLYPVLDDLLAAWRATDHRVVPETKVVGHRWSARSADVREFLGRNQVAYRWYLSDEAEGQRLLVAAGADDLHLPVVISASGEVLVEPTDAELADRVGLDTKPSERFYDLVVVGAGPAGLGAAVYGASEGLRTLLVERTAAGGQAGQSSRIENYLGFPDGVSGAQLTERARRQAIKFGVELVTAREVVGLEANGSARTVRFADGGSVDADAVVLATGVSYRKLTAPGIADLTGRGVFYGSAVSEAPACVGSDVYIVGGANSAGQAAVYFARYARSVTMLVRGASLESSMSYYLVQQIAALPNIKVRTAYRGDRGQRRRAPRDAHPEGQCLRVHRSGRRAMDVCVHRRRTTNRVVGRRCRARQGRVRRCRARSVDRWVPASGLDGGSSALPLGDQRPGGIRGRRCPCGVGKAGGLSCRRRSHGGHARTPVSGEAMTMDGDAGPPELRRCHVDELRGLFLFEALSDEQLGWLCREGRVESVEPSWVYREGERADDFYVLLEGSIVLTRRVGEDDVEVIRTDQRGAYAGAMQAYFGDRVPQVYRNSLRATVPSRFFVLGADKFAHLMREWFPMAVHLLEGLFFGIQNTQQATEQRERLLALGSLSAGLTHELNNPASAAVRATSSLRERVARHEAQPGVDRDGSP